jgi:hypothetical protein
MVGTHSVGRTLEFGIYRDGDNNLDAIQANVLAQARATSAHNRHIEFLVEDTTARSGFAPRHVLRTESYAIADGTLSRRIELGPPHDMSARSTLAHFVRATLDRAEANGAKETWIELVDHGAGDGGGLEADHGNGIMTEDDMARAIADGVRAHARAHPEDAGRRVDGVLANECLMGTLGVASALSHAGVRFLAASPETMLAPGAPTGVADAIARNIGDPDAMAAAVVDRVMRTQYEAAPGERFGPAAAFDVFDLDPHKIAAMEHGVKALNAALTEAAGHRSLRAIVREDARAIDGMVRFPHSAGLPWHADRPALALYDTLASDGRLPAELRDAASQAHAAVADLVLAHGESDDFEPFDDADYSNAAGPTVHFPVTKRQIDAWAPDVSETDNAFYRRTGGLDVATRYS